MSPDGFKTHCGTSVRWLKILLLVLGLIAVASSSLALIPKSDSSLGQEPQLTYRVRRGGLTVTVTEQGALESTKNTEIKCKVRDKAIPIIWVIPSGSWVKAGDVLVRLGTLAYEDRYNQVSRWVHSNRSSFARSAANRRRAELAVSEYIEGRYVTQLKTLQKDLAIAESNLRTARNMLAHAELMSERGYISGLDVERSRFVVTQAELNVGVKQTEIGVLQDYTKAMELETLKGELEASKARHEANKTQVKMSEAQLILCQGDLDNCLVKAERDGFVIYPTGKPWEHVPEIEEGTNVYMGQTMLLMPDLAQMQVKIGVRESAIDLIQPGLKVRVILPNQTLEGEVDTVASVAGPAGWWNGNTVRYDVVIKLPSLDGLMPGMSAEVEVIVAQYDETLIAPVAALVESASGDFCWVKTAAGIERRTLQLGDSNDRFTIVEAGLQDGDEVLLHPLALEEAQALAQQTLEDEVSDANAPDGADLSDQRTSKPPESSAVKKSSKPKSVKPSPKTDKQPGTKKAVNK